MTTLTADHRRRILDAFLAMDEQALTDTGFLKPDWESFMYEGQVTLAGLLHLAGMITCMLYGPQTRGEGEAVPESDLEPPQ